MFLCIILFLLSEIYALDHPGLCKYRTQDPGRHCIDIEETITSDADRQAVLDKINSRRNKVAGGHIQSFPAASNMTKLEWNAELEISAQKWAKQCVRSSVPDIKDACRHSGTTKVGQNIATILGDSPGLKPTTLVDIWYMELLSINSSVLVNYRESSTSGLSHYDYFTQLMWSETKQVGCGSVKFKERLKDGDEGSNQTVYRLVCNFSPEGNRVNQYAYGFGPPCSRCPRGTTCDSEYKALCVSKSKRDVSKKTTKEKVHIPSTFPSTRAKYETSKIIQIPSTSSQITVPTVPTIEDETFTPFDYFSHLHEFTRHMVTTSTKTACKDVLAVDDFIDLLRKKLSSDSVFKDLIFSTKFPTFYNITENTFTDPKVAAFVKRIYSKKEPTTTTRTTENDLLNSTFLVDLVEAVIFRSGDKLPSHTNSVSLQETSKISPIKIQAELGEIQHNNDFTGHYFFPEDDGDVTTETTEAYYDSTIISAADVMMEIEEFKKSTTSDFLEDILELESSIDTTTVTETSMMPDVMTSYQSGRNVMKKFLEEIREKST